MGSKLGRRIQDKSLIHALLSASAIWRQLRLIHRFNADEVVVA
jgi:hypothetical protein